MQTESWLHDDTAWGKGRFMQNHLTLKTVLLFFLPLIFMTELIQVSHSITNAFLARFPAPREALAAFSIAFAFNVMTGGVTMTATQSGISFITDRQAFGRLVRFFLIVMLFPFGIIELISLSPLGDIVFGKWMGASPEVVRQAKWSSAIMGLWTFPILIRNLMYAVVMIRRRTLLISYATAIRLAALVGFLILFSVWFDGAVVGALATVCGMTVEAVYMIFAARAYLPAPKTDTAPQASFGEFWRFSWPLMITQVSENGVVFVITIFLGRLAHPDLAIAAFGVVFSLIRVILAPLRNLVNTAQALIRRREDLGILFQFSFALVLFYIGMILFLFFTPLRGWVLATVMGLTPELSRYCTPALQLTLLVAVFWATAALFRGILSGMRKTGAIAFTAVIRLIVIAGIGSVSFFHIHLNGAVLGVFAIAGAFFAETVVLGRRLQHQSRLPDTLFHAAP